MKKLSLSLLLLTMLCLTTIAQVPKRHNESKNEGVLFNLASPGDSVQYVQPGRVSQSGSMEGQIVFYNLNCDSVLLYVGKTTALDADKSPIGGIFPEYIGELENPVILDTARVDTGGHLLFKKDGKGDIWNFYFTFQNWNAYAIKFTLMDLGGCTEGTIELWR